MFSLKVYAEEDSTPKKPIPLSELELSWQGPTVHKGLSLIQIRADEIPQGNYILKLKTDWEKTSTFDVHIAMSGQSRPDQVFPCYLLSITLNKTMLIELFGLYYNVDGHLLIKGRYRIMGETQEEIAALSWGNFAMMQKDFAGLLTDNLLSDDTTEEEIKIERVNKEMLAKKEWAIDTLQVRDRLGNLLAQTSQISLEGLPPLSNLTVKFFEDGKFKMTGLGKENGDIQGTYETFGHLILFKCSFKGNNFKILSRIMIQTEEEIVGTTNFETYLPGVGGYSKTGFQFQDTLRLTPKQ